MPGSRSAEAIALMNAFAERTGLVGGRPPRRYLWTDAFAVCNYLGLARSTGDARYTRQAMQLVEQVHRTLGRHRGDDGRAGWISGLSGREAELHPTRGGLRIGKALPERAPGEAPDERLEWDRDGQYFHYLCKWMHALDQLTRAAGEPRFNHWARELDRRAFEAFSYQPALSWETRRMYWKMSIDLSRPLVTSMGQHDPLEGYIASLQLRATAAAIPAAPAAPDLENETRQYAAMIRRSDWSTADPLGIGGLLADAWRVRQLALQGATADSQLCARLLDAALAGLPAWAQRQEQQLPARYRLAFRELGLAIGLRAVACMQEHADAHTRAPLRMLMRYSALGEETEMFWRDPANRRGDSWLEHQDINEVMLATCLAPDGFLTLPPPASKARAER